MTGNFWLPALSAVAGLLLCMAVTSATLTPRDNVITAYDCAAPQTIEDRALDKLSTFGVPSGVFPVSLDGEVNVQNFLEIYKMWEKQEEKEIDTGLKEERIFVPGPFDVLLGRQKLAQEHQGNLRFRHIVETFRTAYENNTTRWEKTNIANKIVEQVKQECKGRFLKMDGTGWVEVDDSTGK